MNKASPSKAAQPGGGEENVLPNCFVTNWVMMTRGQFEGGVQRRWTSATGNHLALGDATILRDMDTAGQEETITRNRLVYKLKGHERVLITTVDNDQVG